MSVLGGCDRPGSSITVSVPRETTNLANVVDGRLSRDYVLEVTQSDFQPTGGRRPRPPYAVEVVVNQVTLALEEPITRRSGSDIMRTARVKLQPGDDYVVRRQGADGGSPMVCSSGHLVAGATK